jgi:hypothetical protein
MPRHSAAILTTGAGTTARPMASIYSAAAAGFALRYCAVWNTTATEVDVGLRSLTAATNQGAAETEMAWDANRVAPQCTTHNLHSGDGTLATGFYKRTMLGAAKGSGVIWVFGDSGIVVPEGVANGLGVILASGTGQICIIEFEWDE